MGRLIDDIITSYKIRKPEDLCRTKDSRELIAFDVILLSLGVLLIIVGFSLDFLILKHPYWFGRMSAIVTIICIIISFRSLNKHYRKLLQHGKKEWTSKFQIKVDRTALWMLVLSTIFWAFGDSIINLLKGST